MRAGRGLGLLRKCGAQRQESSQEGRGLEQAAHHLALQCGMFMGVWMAAVGEGGGACPVA